MSQHISNNRSTFDIPFETKVYQQLKNGVAGEDLDGVPCYVSHVETLCNTFALTPSELERIIDSINSNILDLINEREINQAEHIEYDMAYGCVYYYGVSDTPIKLSLREAQTLTFALNTLTISDKTKAQLTSELLFDPQADNNSQEVPSSQKISHDILLAQPSPEVLSALIEAIQLGARLKISYISRSNQGLPKEHLVDPLFIKGYRHKLFLRAWDVRVEQYRTFSLTGITSIVDTQDSVAVVEDESDLMEDLNNTDNALIATLIVPKEELGHFVTLPSCISWTQNSQDEPLFAKRVHLSSSSINNPYRIRLAIQNDPTNKLWFFSYLAHYEQKDNLIFEGCNELKEGYANWAHSIKEQALKYQQQYALYQNK